MATLGSIRARVWLPTVLLTSLASACQPELVGAGAARVPADFVDQSMASMLDEPVGIAEVPDTLVNAPRVLLIEQRTARVRVVVGGSLYTVGTVPNVSSVDPERGLLGIAVDPAWPTRPFIYVHCTDDRTGHHIAISRFTATGDLAHKGLGDLQFDAASRYDLLNMLSDNAITHNGGTLRFGPDRTLYVSLGDDGTLCSALDIGFPVGKILRLDVSRLPITGTGPPPLALLIPPGNPYASQPDSNAMLVWTVGLRNPFRFSVDSQTGTLYVADVGENTWEEMNRVPSGGMNVGWPVFEGPAGYTSCSQTPPSAPVGPIYSYNHSQGAVIISGGLYRRPGNGVFQLPIAYEGDCFFLDYSMGFMRRLKGSGTTWALAAPVPGQPTSTNCGDGFQRVSDVLEMSDGSIWYCRQSNASAAQSGELRRIVSATALAVPTRDDEALVLHAPSPSPSMGKVTLRWSQPRRERVRLVVYDLGGRSVRTLQAGIIQEAGSHERVWDGREDSGAPADPGIYFARLQFGNARRQVRITLLY